MATDLSPILPASVSVFYRGRRCSGLPSDTVPTYYKSTVNLSTITFTNNAVKAAPKGVTGAAYIVHDAAVALYTVGVGNPSNQTNLDNLAKRIAQDFYDWRSVSFDQVYSFVINPAPCGFNDIIEWTYTHEDQATRVRTRPWGGEPEEYQHQDSTVSGCNDASNSPNPVAHVPCSDYFADPESCTGGGGTITLTVAGGVITGGTASGGSFSSTPQLAISDDGGPGSGATGTLTLSGSSLSGVTITAGGSNYSSPIGSAYGGGSKLQRTLFRECLEDGRLVFRFIKYVTIG